MSSQHLLLPTLKLVESIGEFLILKGFHGLDLNVADRLVVWLDEDGVMLLPTHVQLLQHERTLNMLEHVEDRLA